MAVLFFSAAAREKGGGKESSKSTARSLLTILCRTHGGGSGKKKIQITRILDKAKRRVTFSKRRKRLFKKASELDTLCGADTAIITVSEAGTIFTAGRLSLVHGLLFGSAGASVGGRAAAAAGRDMGWEELAAALAAVKKAQLKIELLMMERSNNNNNGNAAAVSGFTGDPVTTPTPTSLSSALELGGGCSRGVGAQDYGFGEIQEELDDFLMIGGGSWSKEEEVNYQELLALLE